MRHAGLLVLLAGWAAGWQVDTTVLGQGEDVAVATSAGPGGSLYCPELCHSELGISGRLDAALRGGRTNPYATDGLGAT